MTDLATLHKSARGLVLALRDGVERLEAAERAGQRPQAAALARDLAPKLADLARVSAQLDGVWRMQALRATGTAADVWRRKVEQVADEAAALRQALATAASRERRRVAEEEARHSLLGDGRGVAALMADADAEGAARAAIGNSKRLLEETFQTGAAVLAGMAGQRDTLKAAQRKALDVLHGLGLSDSLLRMIDRRQKMDVILTYGGMALVAALLLAAWWFLKR